MQRPLVPRGPMTQLKMSDIVISFQFKITLLIQKVGKQNRRQNMSYVGGGGGGGKTSDVHLFPQTVNLAF